MRKFLMYIPYAVGGVLTIVLMSAQGAPPPEAFNALRQTFRPAGEQQEVTREAMEGIKIRKAESGYLRHISAPRDHYFTVKGNVPGRPDETAKNFLKEHHKLLAPISALSDFSKRKSKRMRDHIYIRFSQTYAGIPVFGSNAIIQLNNSGGVQYATIDISQKLHELDGVAQATVPTVSSEEAGQIAKNHVSRQADGSEIDITTPQLKYFDPSILGATGQIRLVWELETHSEEAIDFNRKLLIDAKTRKVVRAYPLAVEALDRHIRDADGDHKIGFTKRKEGEGRSSISNVNDAYDFAGDAYEFFSREHGRDGIGDNGHNIKVTVRSCPKNKSCPWKNAWWVEWRRRLYFGNRMVVDDVFGHEYTHGVISFESELVYENSSGAISEGLSDLWGEFIDLTNNSGTDSDEVRWLIGEDIPTTIIARGYSRNMKDPTATNHPDRMSSEYYKPRVEIGRAHV